MTVELAHEKKEGKPISSRAKIARRVGSIRVTYGLVIAVACWFALTLFLYILRTVGFIDGR